MGARILVIEDNPANMALMTYLLRAFGHTVLTAEDGQQGLDATRRERPDLVICDVQLPEIDGHEVARRLKSDALLRTIPLVAVTALAMVGDRDRILAAGFDGYLSKPINPESFVSQVELYLQLEQRTNLPATAPTAAPAPAQRAARRYTVLVVDNLPVNLDLARSILEPFGYQVFTAEGTAEALAQARKGPCDLILSDVCMTGETGYDFIQSIRADPQLRDIPFVFLTSTMLEEKDRAKGLALGATRFLIRPIEPEALLAEIEACLRKPETN